MSSRRLAAKRRRAAREMHARGIAKREIARRLGVTPKSIRRYLGEPEKPRDRTMPDADLLLEEGLAYHARFGGELPTSTTFNATRARAAGPEPWRRHCEGWVSRRDSRWRPWSQHSALVRRFGSHAGFIAALQREIARRAATGNPYEALPVPKDVAALAAVEAANRAASRPNVRVDPSVLLEEPEMQPTLGGDIAHLTSYEGPTRVIPARERQGLAIAGSPGVGKTSALAPVALADALEPELSVVVVERVPAVAGRPFPTCHPCDLADAVLEGQPVSIASNDDDIRRLAITGAAYAAVVSGRDVSLLVDDAGSLVPQLLILAHEGLPTLHLTVAWNPEGRLLDGALFMLLASKILFRMPDLESAEIMVDAWNATVVDGFDPRAPG